MCVKGRLDALRSCVLFSYTAGRPDSRGLLSCDGALLRLLRRREVVLAHEGPLAEDATTPERSAYFQIQHTMTARRQLGGGRVLGNGRELSPAAAVRPVQHQRNSSLLSPSESSVSLASQASNSNSPASTIDNENITSRISLDQSAATVAAAAAREQLVCPICNDVMVRCPHIARGGAVLTTES